jgi:hypothetical protein
LSKSGSNKISWSTGKFGTAQVIDFAARLRPLGFGAAAFARFACHLWHRLAEPKLAKRAKAGGPGRTRTCNQTVMSGKGCPEETENADESGDD